MNVIFLSFTNSIKEFFSVAIAGLAFPGLNLTIKPGLYSIGNPDEKSPVLVSANYFVTYKRVVSSLEKQNITAWLLVVDTEGVNVWCSSAGGHFTAEKVLDQIEDTDLSEVVNHNQLILPQLSASGVNHLILKKAKWNVKFGPINIDDLREYLDNNYKKSVHMSTVSFNLWNRIENSFSHNVFISLILIPLILGIAILAQPLSFILNPWSQWLIKNILFLLLYVWIFGFILGLLYPSIPLNSGFFKGVILSAFIVPINVLVFFSTTPLDFVMAFGTLLLYSFIIGTDFDGFTPFWGTDFIIKDLILLAGAVIILFLGIILSPFVIGG